MTRTSAALVAAISMLVSLSAVGPAPAEATANGCLRAPLDVMLVMDRSGSMSGDPLATAQAGASTFVDRLESTEHSGLVSYSDTATLDAGLSPDHEATKAAIGALVASGLTATGSAISVAHAEFQVNGRADVSHVMVVMTDGVTNAGPSAVAEATAAKGDGIEIYAIGLGPSVNEAELMSVASTPTDSHYFHPLTTAALLDVFEELTRRILAPMAVSESFTVGGEAVVHRLSVGITVPLEAGVAINKVGQARMPIGQETTVDSRRVTQGGFHVDFETSHSIADGGTTSSLSASRAHNRIEGVTVTQAATGDVLLRVRVVETEAYAVAGTASAFTDDGETRFVGLTVLGQAFSGRVPPNTNVSFGPPLVLGASGYVTLNEQVQTLDPTRSELRVNAIHLYVENVIAGHAEVDLVIGSAYAGAACGVTGLAEPEAAPSDPLTVFAAGIRQDIGP